MRALPAPLRKQLESAVLDARRVAESASRAAIDGLGVFVRDKPTHLDAHQARLRNGLRAKWRQLGGDAAAQPLLIAECAYEQWHRLLFARFLAENHLLLHPQYEAVVTLADCEDLAAVMGEPDGWSVAARFAAEILPGIFRLDDPCVRLRLAPEGRHALEEILDGLPTDVFAADDALGWVYQFWQKDKKDEVNASERKIGGADLGPVTQLFTENYMVRFLLENSLGAWWAARHPDSPLAKDFEYLRFDDDGRPAAGSFDGWPDRVAEVTVMDPCCGSGHFLVEAFSMLWQMRAEEEGLSAVDAQDAALHSNLFGLELDPRCVQIAMLAVAMQAWKAGGGWRQLPVPNIACSGIPVRASVEEWKALANGNERIESALVRLHVLFRQADTLGSLIDPRQVAESSDVTGAQRSFDDADWSELEAILADIDSAETQDPAAQVLGADAIALGRAARLLARQYLLLATNVPFLGINKHSAVLRSALSSRYFGAHHDLAYAMTTRCIELAIPGAGVLATISPSEWLFSTRVTHMRRSWLQTLSISTIARLGYRAFSAGLRVNPTLQVAARRPPAVSSSLYFVDISESAQDAESVARELLSASQSKLSQLQQLSRSDSIISPNTSAGTLLEAYADCRWGLSAGDGSRFERYFWEIPRAGGAWEYLQTSTTAGDPYGGRSSVVLWENERGQMAELANSVRHLNNKAQQWRSGKPFWGKRGIAINTMGSLRASIYTGDRYSATCMVIVPRDDSLVPSLWRFASSGGLEAGIREISRSLAISPGTVLKVPFDIEHWRAIDEAAGPLPEPWSDDPTLWLFDGRLQSSRAVLQVVVGRLVGYRWPEQKEVDDLDALGDSDGIVCLPSVAGESPAADRAQEMLAAAFGESWSPPRIKGLLEQAGSKKDLGAWLRDEFFKGHCAMFGNRPFVWHIWDGQRDGFAALVNYHRLDRKLLEKLTYTYLGQDWVERQRAEVRDEVAGAEARLSAALELQRKLQAIIDGEKPYDIYVRWKELHDQSVGWDPDLNDGVRLNVRPFVEAGVLRAPFNVHWKKDRGKNPDGSERHNDLHLSLAEKLDARKRAGRA